MDAVRWLFFDVGSTLVDETAAYDHRIREMIAGTDVTNEQFQRKREEFARQNLRGDLEAAAYFGLSKTPWHHEDERPYAAAEATLRTLKARGYRIGIIANQSAGTEERLRVWGLMTYIDIVIASAEEGVAKPDPAIFRIALDRASCLPEQAAMIGDRLDNDVVPAKAIGMRTVWLPQGPAAWHSPRNATETPDMQVHDLAELTALFQCAAPAMERVARRIWRVPPEEAPLSADAFIIEGDARYYVFDVGAGDAAFAAIRALNRPVTVILSHFHRDHTANLARLAPEEVLVGARTRRQLGQGTLVDAPLVLQDGVTIEVRPCVSPHAPGCLIATVDGEVTLIGDLAYARPGTGQGEAKGMLNALKHLKTHRFIPSHRTENPVVEKEAMLDEIRVYFGIV